MTTPLLETRDLGVRFGGVRAVRDVNFVLAERELRCLIGPNGAGKSTFFKMLTGQLAPSQGVVLFRGRDESRTRKRTRSPGSESASKRRCRACSTASACGKTSGCPRSACTASVARTPWSTTCSAALD